MESVAYVVDKRLVVQVRQFRHVFDTIHVAWIRIVDLGARKRRWAGWRDGGIARLDQETVEQNLGCGDGFLCVVIVEPNGSLVSFHRYNVTTAAPARSVVSLRSAER